MPACLTRSGFTRALVASSAKPNRCFVLRTKALNLVACDRCRCSLPGEGLPAASPPRMLKRTKSSSHVVPTSCEGSIGTTFKWRQNTRTSASACASETSSLRGGRAPKQRLTCSPEVGGFRTGVSTNSTPLVEELVLQMASSLSTAACATLAIRLHIACMIWMYRRCFLAKYPRRL